MVSRVFSSKEEDQNMCQLLLLLSKIYTGALVLRWIMRQCNEHKKVSEYQRSYKELKIFLRDKWTIDDLGSLCVSAISMFAETLIEKETYLGNHMRLHTTNCIDSETTSPVESQNSIVKEKLGVGHRKDS
jgi:hypothetical protein